MTEQPILQTEDVSRRFGGLFAVRNVTFALAARGLHAVIGPNGAGKSTFVNLLSGQVAPSGGRILLRGQDVAGLPAWRFPHLGVTRSFQRTNIFKSFTVHENVRLAAQATRVFGKDMFSTVRRTAHLNAIADRAIERVGLVDQRETVAGILSHGAQRQLEIAMTLAVEPQVILLDEPLAGMGQDESERMAGLMGGLAEDHAVLLIEHDMDFVFQVADQMTVLVEGKILATGTPDDIRRNAAVQAAYLGDSDVH